MILIWLSNAVSRPIPANLYDLSKHQWWVGLGVRSAVGHLCEFTWIGQEQKEWGCMNSYELATLNMNELPWDRVALSCFQIDSLYEFLNVCFSCLGLKTHMWWNICIILYSSESKLRNNNIVFYIVHYTSKSKYFTLLLFTNIESNTHSIFCKYATFSPKTMCASHHYL